jgi:catechol 2,3-dioxygenase-like lactoylglutathione lyase family enzyme
MKPRRFMMLSANGCLLLGAALAGALASETVPETRTAAHFHHVHLNVTDPERSIDFYRRILGGVPIRFRDRADAIFTERSFLLFQRVEAAPPATDESGIWHLGWGGKDVESDYKWLLRQGVAIHTPLYPLGGGHVVYLYGPDREMIEINTMGHHRFGHIHLLAEDPNTTAAWYAKHLGLEARRGGKENPRPVGPSAAFASWQEFHAQHRAWSNGFVCDNVSFVVYNLPDYVPPPPWWRRSPLTELAPQRGRVIDHIAFSYRDIAPVFERMRRDGVSIVEPIRASSQLGLESFFVMGPDGVTLEIVEEKPVPEGIWD